MAHYLHSSHGVDKRIWQLLWKSSLHEHHKILIWRISVDIILTKDRIKQFVPLSEVHCYICGQATECLHHLLLDCPLAKLCWWNSTWNVKLTNFTIYWFQTGLLIFWILILFFCKICLPWKWIEWDSFLLFLFNRFGYWEMWSVWVETWWTGTNSPNE